MRESRKASPHKDIATRFGFGDGCWTLGRQAAFHAARLAAVAGPREPRAPGRAGPPSAAAPAPGRRGAGLRLEEDAGKDGMETN